MIFILNKIKKIFLEKYLVQLSLIFSLPISIFFSIVFFSISPRNYSLGYLAQATSISLIPVFIIVFYILRRRRERILMFFKGTVFAVWNAYNFFKRVLLIFLSLISLWILINISNIQDVGINFYKAPIHIYHIEITPDENSEGGICLWDIRNSYGHIQRYNETIKNLSIIGDWKRNINNCVLSLDDGEFGKIAFDNQGPINDTLQFWASFGSKNGKLNIITYPGTTENFTSSSFYNLPLGKPFFRKITNWGFFGGLIFFLGIILVALPGAFYSWMKRKTTFLKNLIITVQLLFAHCSRRAMTGIKNSLIWQREYFSLYRRLWIIWHQLDQNKTSIFALVLLFFISTLLKIFVYNFKVFGPVHFGDELRYWDTAINIFRNTFSPFTFYRSPPFYPISLLPVFNLFNQHNVYSALKVLNSVYLTSAIFPIFFISRRILRNNVSLLIVLLTTLNPMNIVIPGRVLSENLFYPLFMWASFLATFDILRTKKYGYVVNDFLLGVLISSVFLTRYIALVLIPGFLLIWWVKISSKENSIIKISWRKILRSVIVVIPMFLMIGGWVFWGVKNGRTPMDMIGLFIAADSNPAQLTGYRLIMWSVFYLSYTVLIFSPFLPILLTSLSKFHISEWRSEKNRWIISTIIITMLLLIASIRHSWKIPYNYPNPLKLQGRYILYFGPMFLITAFTYYQTSIRKEVIFKYLVFSITFTLLSYAILFLGFFYLKEPLNISRSSPEGEVMEAIGIGYLALLIIVILLTSLIKVQKLRKILLPALFFVLFFFYFISDLRFLRSHFESVHQVPNSQILHLLEYHESFEGDEKTEETSFVFRIRKNTKDVNISRWKSTLLFRGYENVDFIEEKNLDFYPSTIFNVEINNQVIGLRLIERSEYDETNFNMYEFAGKYYEYFLH